MRDWFRAATTPRMLGIFAFLLVGAIVCARLGAWQIDRAIGAAEQQAAIEQSERENSAPVALAGVVAPQVGFTQAMVGTRVQVTGQWQPDLQYWVPEREVDGAMGYLLVTAFREQSTGALMPVARGWVAQKDPRYLEVAAGTVQIMGYLDGSEAAEHGVQSDDEIDTISAGALVNVWGAPIYGGYLILIDSDPVVGGPGWAPDGAAPVVGMPPPVVPDSGGLNLRNLAYAIEWFIFGGFAMFLWWRMVRDEVLARREDAPASAAAA